MPNVLLPVPFFRQSRDGFCLPACAAMILAYWGQMTSEAEMSKLLQTKSYGTPFSNITRLTQRGFQVEFGSQNEWWLRRCLDNRRPVIARLWTSMLDHWTVDTSHVVVIVGFDDSGVYVNDPAFDQAPMAVSQNSFLAAWTEFDRTAASIFR